ncbi:hypothetical protein E2I00_002721 [Balaenoptera physalus]|uniref:GPR158/179 extracellular domain-containing protein n=1 Tax=Balaenoptera physalus TaxID=9770 RepID=A0A643CFW9_BALPH|nr:hypothetical protein E2I00_002721 [Balaenoptera physalus]
MGAMAYPLLFCLLLVHLGLGAVGAGRDPPSRTDSPREKTLRAKQHAQQPARASASDPSAPWSRSTDGTILAQKIAEEVPMDVASYLYTGDSHQLKRANCSSRYELAGLPGKSPALASSHPSLHGALDTLTHATNFLNMMLQSNKSREQNLQDDLEWYQALVRSLLEGEPSISRAAITFSTESLSAPAPQVFLQATREESRILLQDLSSSAHHLANATLETEWFHGLRRKWRTHLHRRGSNQGPRGLGHSWRRRDGLSGDKSHVKWSSPYLECENGSYKPGWLVTLSAAFYGLQPNLVPEFRGVMKVDINLQKVDIDQCSSDGWFSGTHKCHLNNSECMPIKGLGFVLGAYQCICKAGFYHPRVFSVNSFQIPDQYLIYSQSSLEGCPYCADDSPCFVQEDKYLRLAIISFQALCMLLDFVSMLVVYRFRKAKSIRASGLILLETILFGSLLLYFPRSCWVANVVNSPFRFVLASRLQSDWMLMLYFAHTHLTVTVTIGLLLIPKFSHSSNNPRDDIATEAYEDELDMGRSGSYLNSSINSAWSEHSLDPEDIRDELKKLYAQLEIYKRKKMITNNPHLQKKRCSKKGLGRSIMRRITEIPETVSRQCSKEDKDAVIASAKEKTLGLAGKTQASGVEERAKAQKALPREKETNRKYSNSDNAETQDSAPPNSNHSEEPRKPPKSGIMRQQRANPPAANSDLSPGATQMKDSFDIGEVCPWEIYDLTPGPVPSESKVQKHVSIAASEMEKTPIFSLKEKSHPKPKAAELCQQSNPKSIDKAEVCPWEIQGQSLFEDAKYVISKTQVPPGRAQGENGGQQSAASVCAGQCEELPPKAVASKVENENLNQLGDQEKKTSSSEQNVPDSYNSSNNFQQSLTSRAEVCPWEFETPDQPNAERSVAIPASSALSANKIAGPRK